MASPEAAVGCTPLAINLGAVAAARGPRSFAGNRVDLKEGAHLKFIGGNAWGWHSHMDGHMDCPVGMPSLHGPSSNYLRNGWLDAAASKGIALRQQLVTCCLLGYVSAPSAVGVVRHTGDGSRMLSGLLQPILSRYRGPGSGVSEDRFGASIIQGGQV
jgi:hypothetical protein